MDNKKCILCGKEFVDRTRNGNAKFCSKYCNYTFHNLIIKKKRMENKVHKKCLYCGNIIINRGNNSKCCGRNCSIENRRRKNEKKLSIVQCIICGREIYTKFDRTKLCSDACRSKNWRLNNPLKLKEMYRDAYLKRKRTGYFEVKETLEKLKIARTNYRINNHQKIISYESNRRHMDISYRIRLRLRSLASTALRRYTLTGKIMSSNKYGINYKMIAMHLKPFPEDISQYHIDHIKPLCSFDLTNPEEVKKAFAPENHRWLKAEENLKKISEDKKMSIFKRESK